MKHEKIFLFLFYLSIFSLLFDASISLSVFHLNEKYFLAFEANKIFSSLLLSFDFFYFSVFLFASVFPLSVSFLHFLFYAKTGKKAFLFFSFLITFLYSFLHLFGAFTWLIP